MLEPYYQGEHRLALPMSTIRGSMFEAIEVRLVAAAHMLPRASQAKFGDSGQKPDWVDLWCDTRTEGKITVALKNEWKINMNW